MKTVLVCAAQAPFVTGGAEILVSELRANHERRGFRVLLPERIPCNDGGLAYGQVAEFLGSAAAARAH